MKVALIGATYTGNRGAAAMLISTVERLREGLPGNTEFHVLSLYRESPDTAERRGVQIVHLPATELIGVLPWLAFLHRVLGWIPPLGSILRRYRPLRTLVDADVLLDLSGISFVDGRGPTLLYNVCCLLPAQILRVPVFKMSQALGPFSRRLNRWAAKLLLPRVRHIFSRGSRTTSHLQSIGLDNWSESADLAFLLGDPRSPTGGPGSAAVSSSLTLGVAPSQVLLEYCRMVGVDYLGTLSRAVECVAATRDTHLVVLAHSNLGENSGSRNNDFQVCRSLFDACECESKSLVVDDLSPEELRSVIADCDVFIASRFHAMISALCEKVPVLVTSWSHKYREVMEEFECEEWVIAKEDLTGDPFAKKLMLLIDKKDQISETIARRLPAARESAQVQISDVVSFLLGSRE